MSLKPSYKQDFARSAGESKYPALWRGLVGAWCPSLGHTGIFTLRDVSGKGNHGAMVGGFVAGNWHMTPEGYALGYNGINNKVTLANFNPLLTNQITVVARIKRTDDITFHHAVSRHDGWWLSGSGSNNIRFATITSGEVSTNSYSLALDEWYNIVGVYDGAYVYLYVNGVLFHKIAQTGNMSASGSMRIGGYWGNDTFNWKGGIGNLLIYNRAFAPSEVKFVNANPLALFQLADLPFGVAAEVVAAGIEIFRRRIEGY